MSKYYLKPHITDEMLEAVGFVINNYSAIRNSNWKNPHKELNQLHAQIFIGLDDKRSTMKSYMYRYILWNYHVSLAPSDIRPYIQDLIDIGYVEVRND